MSAPYLNYSQDNSEKKDLIGNYLGKVRANLKLFVLISAISLAGAYVYLRYAVPLYSASATLLITDESKESEMSIFEDLGLGAGNDNITDEIAVITSRILVRRVVDSLDLCYDYEAVGRISGFRRVNLYDASPLKLEFFNEDEAAQNLSLTLNATILEGDVLEIEYPVTKQSKKVRVGQWITTNGVRYRLIKTQHIKKFDVGTKISVKHIPVETAISTYIGKLSVINEDKTSNLINISMEDVSSKRAENVINTLILQYNLDVVADKNEVSENTANFINERMRLISLELETIESSAQDYKTDNKLVDITSEAALYLQNESELNKQILETTTQSKLAGYMIEYLDNISSSNELMPTNLGLTDLSVQNSIESYNKLVQDRNRALKTSSEKSPFVIAMETQIIELRKSLKESLRNHKRSLDVKLAEYKRSENKIDSQISSVPKYEREYRSIMRQQQIKESL